MGQSITITILDKRIERHKLEIIGIKQKIKDLGARNTHLEKDLTDLENERIEILQKTTLR